MCSGTQKDGVSCAKRFTLHPDSHSKLASHAVQIKPILGMAHCFLYARKLTFYAPDVCAYAHAERQVKTGKTNNRRYHAPAIRV